MLPGKATACARRLHAGGRHARQEALGPLPVALGAASPGPAATFWGAHDLPAGQQSAVAARHNSHRARGPGPPPRWPPPLATPAAPGLAHVAPPTGRFPRPAPAVAPAPGPPPPGPSAGNAGRESARHLHATGYCPPPPGRRGAPGNAGRGSADMAWDSTHCVALANAAMLALPGPWRAPHGPGGAACGQRVLCARNGFAR